MPNEMQAQWKSSWLDSGNQSYLDNQYEAFLKDPQSVPMEWRKYFTSLGTQYPAQPDISHADIRELFKNISYQAKNVTQKSSGADQDLDQELRQIAVQKLIFAYRLLGHLNSNINPIAKQSSKSVPELELSYYDLHTMDLGSMV